MLLAKSEPQITLKQHTEDGLEVWKHLQTSFPLATKIAQKENFWWLLRLAVITHDLGKAHQEFQKILRGEDNKWNKQRHELFSLPFVAKLPLNEVDKTMVMRVVAAHHRSYKCLREFISYNYDPELGDFVKEFSMIDIEGAVKIANELEKEILLVPIDIIDPSRVIIEYNQEIRKRSKQRNDSKKDLFTQLLMMGAFHHCDHLASGFVTSFPNLGKHHFGFLERMRTKLLKQEKQFYKHQDEALETIGNVILTAPTGSGKTETSMLWLKQQLEKTGQGRTFYILPFTASINAMYKRLASEKDGVGDDMVGMLHGKLNAYLYENFFAEAGDLQDLKEKIKSVKEQFKNLETPVKISTPFQLLKYLFGLKGFEKGIFEWTGGYFIFDEIHAYDPKITAQIIVLLEFLTQKMEAKVFIMTATLPTFLKDIIKKSINDNFTEITASNELYDDFKRHRLKLEEGLLLENFSLIEKELNKGRNVLIVCNTVDASRTVFDYFKDKYESLLLHGRFAAKDRNDIEKQLGDKPPQLLIGTQAIEVSLDIDYDIIFTEPAPLDALIQRFGRVNRKRSKEPCSCIVFKERNKSDKYVYKDEEVITKTLNVLEDIASKNNGVIQEIELQDYIDIVYPKYNKDAQEEFNIVYKYLNKHINKLFPFNPSKEGEDAYYKQFDGVKVVPAFYENQYENLLEQFDFIGAELLKVSLRSGRFNQFFNTVHLETLQRVVVNPNRENSDPITIDYYKLNKKYDPETGLDFSIDEMIIDQSQILD